MGKGDTLLSSGKHQGTFGSDRETTRGAWYETGTRVCDPPLKPASSVPLWKEQGAICSTRLKSSPLFDVRSLRLWLCAVIGHNNGFQNAVAPAGILQSEVCRQAAKLLCLSTSGNQET